MSTINYCDEVREIIYDAEFALTRLGCILSYSTCSADLYEKMSESGGAGLLANDIFEQLENIKENLKNHIRWIKILKKDEFTPAFTRELTELNPDVAQAIVLWHQQEADFDGVINLIYLKELLPESAIELARSDLDLSFSCLKELSEGAAMALRKHVADLYLSETKQISLDALKALNGHKGSVILGLEDANGEEIYALADVYGDVQVKGVTASGAYELVKRGNSSIELGFCKLDVEIATELGKYRQDLYINVDGGFKKEELIKLLEHQGDLSIFCRTDVRLEIDDELSHSLAEHQGPITIDHNNIEISDDNLLMLMLGDVNFMGQEMLTRFNRLNQNI